jgi:hypothetical protein
MDVFHPQMVVFGLWLESVQSTSAILDPRFVYRVQSLTGIVFRHIYYQGVEE